MKMFKGSKTNFKMLSCLDLNKPRYKQIENFFRRMAFNLGNTPSRTEVKVISCIPIDVSELQQKIICLEKELDTYRCPESCDKGKKKKSRTSSDSSHIVKSASPVVQTALDRHNGIFSSHTRICDDRLDLCCSCHTTSLCYLTKDKVGNQLPPAPASSAPEETTQSPQGRDFCKKLFAKRKRYGRGKAVKSNTQLVYYAQPQLTTPFNRYNIVKNTPKQPRPNHQSTNEVLETHTQCDCLSSEYSAPICRDVISTNLDSALDESDHCSSSQGIDNRRNSYYDTTSYVSANTDSNSSYYDSNFYDIVPVKEKELKESLYIDMQKKRDRNIESAALYYHEERPRKYKNDPISVNCKTLQKKDTVLFHLHIRSSSDNNDTTEISHNSFDETSLKSNIEETKLITRPLISKHDAACLTRAVVDTDCQAGDSFLVKELKNSAENTLNKVKEILQSALFEVKTNMKVNKKKKYKQNVNSNVLHSMQGGSQFLQSYTYSPYNMFPCHMPPLSCQSPYFNTHDCAKVTNQCSIGPEYAKYMCPKCHKNKSQVLKDDKFGVKNGETDNYIKEIYRTVTQTAEIPTNFNNNLNLSIKSEVSLIHCREKEQTSFGIPSREVRTKDHKIPICEVFKNSTQSTNTVTDTIFSGNTTNKQTKMTTSEGVQTIRQHRISKITLPNPSRKIMPPEKTNYYKHDGMNERTATYNDENYTTTSTDARTFDTFTRPVKKFKKYMKMVQQRYGAKNKKKMGKFCPRITEAEESESIYTYCPVHDKIVPRR